MLGSYAKGQYKMPKCRKSKEKDKKEEWTKQNGGCKGGGNGISLKS